MKLGFFCNEYPPRPHGGIGTFVWILATELARAGHEITVVQFGDRAASESRDGVRIVTLPESRTRHIAWLRNRLRLWRWLRREALAGRMDVFEIPEYQGCLPFPISVCRVVVRLHHSESGIQDIMNPGTARRRIYWLEKATLFWHRRWIAVSRHILNETRRYFGIEPVYAQVIYNPAPAIVREELPALPTRPKRYVVYAGSVSEPKGALILARAMREIFVQYSDIHLVFVGPETEYRGAPISKAILAAVGTQYADRVHFTGRLSREYALAWMSGALVFVLPSKVEAFPLVVEEAMALGVPVIFSACGPGPEIIEDGVDGILVSADSKDELARSIRSVLDDPDRAQEMAKAGQRKVRERFGLSTCVAQSLDFYSRALKTCGRELTFGGR